MWADLIAHPQHETRRWEAKRLQYRLFTIPATIARHGRRITLHLSDRSRWADLVRDAIRALRAMSLPAPNG